MTAAIYPHTQLKAIASSHIQENPYRWQLYVLALILVIGGFTAGIYVELYESRFWGIMISGITAGMVLPLVTAAACTVFKVIDFKRNPEVVEALAKLGPAFAGSRIALRQERDSICVLRFREYQAREGALESHLHHLNAQTVVDGVTHELKRPGKPSIYLIATHGFERPGCTSTAIANGLQAILERSTSVHFDPTVFHKYVQHSPAHVLHLAAKNPSYQALLPDPKELDKLFTFEWQYRDEIRDAVQFLKVSSLQTLVTLSPPHINEVRKKLAQAILPHIQAARAGDQQMTFVVHATLLPLLVEALS